jgi:hypothetical protein
MRYNLLPCRCLNIRHILNALKQSNLTYIYVRGSQRMAISISVWHKARSFLCFAIKNLIIEISFIFLMVASTNVPYVLIWVLIWVDIFLVCDTLSIRKIDLFSTSDRPRLRMGAIIVKHFPTLYACYTV